MTCCAGLIRGILLWLLALGSNCGIADPIEKPTDYRFQVEVLAGGMPKPMELEVAPDGRIFFNEISGDLKIYKPESEEVVLAGNLEVFGEQENGFLGFALDPEFESNQWIYLIYSPKEFSGQRVSRFEMDGDRLVIEAERVLLEFEEQRIQCCHHAGSVEFAPDGCLLISTGDNTFPAGDTAGYAPIDERPDHGPIDAQKSSANTNDLRGKILRIRPTLEGSYEIPDGNLFPRDGSEGRPEIFVMGCRNPWRMSVDEVTGAVYWGEVGPDAGGDTPRGSRGYDEINQAKSAGNYGWPYFVGKNFPYSDFDFATGEVGPLYDPARPVNRSPNNTGAEILPPAREALIYWPYAGSEEFPILGAGGRTACAGPVFHYEESFEKTDGFPKHFDKCLLFWDWERPFMKWARLDSELDLEGIEDFTTAIEVGRASGNEGSSQVRIQRPVDADFGPEGCLYLLDYGETWGANKDSQLLKISYVRGNLPPIARARIMPKNGREPLTLKLDGSQSNDVDGSELFYEWRQHPGGKVLSRKASDSVTLENIGNYAIELRVRDEGGLDSFTSLPVIVGNSAPKVVIQSPKVGDFFTPGESLEVKIRVLDQEDGDSEELDELMESRTTVSAEFRESNKVKEIVPAGLAMMRSSDCFNCHAVNRRIVGPALIEIAGRYLNQPDALTASVQRVLKGSSGVWGGAPMLPHSQLEIQQIEKMVKWIFAITPDQNTGGTFTGLQGSIAVPDDGGLRFAKLSAMYTDFGRGALAQLSSEESILLRSRKIEAEHCDDAVLLNVSGNRLGSIKHGAVAIYKGLRLNSSSRLKVRASSGGSGCQLEVRAGSKTGQLLARFEVKNTGGWGEFVDLESPLVATEEPTDVALVFLKAGTGGLMDLDWIEFLK